MTQGQSGATRFKEERFAPIFAQSLLISKAASVARFPYYHVDLHAGAGFNHQAQVWGSPLNFLSAVQRHRRDNFYAFFVDKDPSAIRQLIARDEIEANSARVFLFQSDNDEVLSVVHEFIAARERNPHFAMGSIVIDPNGYHEGVPWRSLRTFCQAHPRFDVILNLNIRSFRLERACILALRPGFEQKQVRPISSFAEWFSRPNWMWTDVLQVKGNSWMQLVGRTLRTDSVGYSRLGFYDSQSEHARHILGDVEGPTLAALASGTPQLPFLSDV